jgi:hypothetical protein
MVYFLYTYSTSGLFYIHSFVGQFGRNQSGSGRGGARAAAKLGKHSEAQTGAAQQGM